jgi:dTDP-4-amino-4,6-dideoxygalactose transaminase
MIPFSQPYTSRREAEQVHEAIQSHRLSGDGPFTRRCHLQLSSLLAGAHVLLTHSATAALEMCALLADLAPGDEVIMPSFTFVSTANAVVLRGAVPVFVDIREDTLNIDENLVEAAITPRTRAILPVHYAGVACEMESLLAIAKRHGLLVIEDAAQAVMAAYRGRPLGTLGQMAALSFHATKNIGCGEGGAFITTSTDLAERAEIVREKGTNRSRFFRGQVDKYTWVATGSSYLPSELNAAVLDAQLQEAKWITDGRLGLWNRYHEAFASEERAGRARRPIVPPECQHNGHLYYLLLPDLASRTAFIERMKTRGITASFHYVPLHAAEHAATCTRSASDLDRTVNLSERLVRLPLWTGLESRLDEVIEASIETLQEVA